MYRAFYVPVAPAFPPSRVTDFNATLLCAARPYVLSAFRRFFSQSTLSVNLNARTHHLLPADTLTSRAKLNLTEDWVQSVCRLHGRAWRQVVRQEQRRAGRALPSARVSLRSAKIP
ncbi:hypothetical protein FRC12_018891 [Ceratobasidium sp. 428]|nr:hypothetical protein FRC12_018891 [Ceratobasidium sp. 428]